MKKSINLFLVTLITVAFLNAPAKAAYSSPQNHDSSTGIRDGGQNSSSQGNFSDHRSGHSYSGFNMNQNSLASPGTNLPINSGVLFLLVAGMAIGIIAIKKYTALKPVLIKQK